MTRKEAKISNKKYYNTCKPCKAGHFSPRYTSTGICAECNRLAASNFRAKNSELISQRKRKYRQENKKIVNYNNALRRANRIKATPIWLTKEQLQEIRLIYETCPDGYHVDHIYPLRNEALCGLHVPWNLQHLKSVDNLKKFNKLIGL